MPLIQAVVTDIEGTTSALAVLREVLAPYARMHLRDYVAAHRDAAEVHAALEATRVLASEPSASETRTLDVLERWIDEDRKAAPLKILQGLVWERGYREGTLRAHVYPDVPPALRALKQAGQRLYVYSSGSVLAQQLFFEHTEEGDLRALFNGYFDTRVGAKGEAESYRAIAGALGLAPEALLFLSDSQAELDAARAAGLNLCGVAREGNPPLRGHPTIRSFSELAGLLESSRGSPKRTDVARELVALARFCNARQWASATSGNFSARLGAEQVAITCSGRDKGSISEADIVLVDLDGRALEATGPVASAETQLHCAIYRAHMGVSAVAHTHSVAATVLSRRYLARGMLCLSGYEMQKAIDGVASHEQEFVIPVVANAQDMGTLGATVERALGAHPGAPAYLVAGHGLTTWARDTESVKRQVEALEFLLACVLAAEQVYVCRAAAQEPG